MGTAGFNLLKDSAVLASQELTLCNCLPGTHGQLCVLGFSTALHITVEFHLTLNLSVLFPDAATPSVFHSGTVKSCLPILLYCWKIYLLCKHRKYQNIFSSYSQN